jgi:hypothetical protein
LSQRELEPVEKPSWRKPAGALGIVLYIIFWVVLITTFSSEIGSLPILVQLLIYIVMGVVWIAPLKPVLRWMELGRWR